MSDDGENMSDDDDTWEPEFPFFAMYSTPTTREELADGLRNNFTRPIVVNRYIEEGTPNLTETCPAEFAKILEGNTEVGDVKFAVRRHNSKTKVT